MKKLTFCFLALFIIAGFKSYSDPITLNQAQTLAKNIYFERVNLNKQVLTLDVIQPILTYTAVSGTTNSFFVFNIVVNNQPAGFVIVSADNDVNPVLGYSFNGYFNIDKISSGFSKLLNSYSQQINYVQVNHFKADQNIQSQWSKYSQQTMYPARDTRSASPLLSTTWGQERYYNELCPKDASVPPAEGGRVPVGCVALAMGEVMRYYQYPAKGTGSHSYIHTKANGYSNDYGTLSANFGNTTYNWSNMPTQLSGSTTTSQDTSVSTLLYQCGVSIEMNYAPDGSGSQVYKIPSALKTYFGYNSAVWLIESMNTSNWETIMTSELDGKRPVIYSGIDSSNSSNIEGHAFVLDGYQTATPNNSFHIDWGWDGQFNGYFTLTKLNPSTYKFTASQQAVVGIIPNKMALMDFTKLSHSPVKEYDTFTVVASVANYDTLDYTGNIDAVLLDNSSNVLQVINTMTGQTLKKLQAYYLTFSSMGVKVSPGSYQIGIRYMNSNGNMTLIPQSFYLNPTPIQILPGLPGNGITLYSQLSINPNPVNSGKSFDVTVNLINYDTVNTFTGNIIAGIWDTATGNIFPNMQVANQTLAPRQYFNTPLTFHFSTFFEYNGTYKFGIFYQKSGDQYCTIAGSGIYQNPISLRVINTSDIPDNILNTDNFTIYPNPTDGNFNIKFSNSPGKMSCIKIYDLTGRLVKTVNTYSGQEEVSINLDSSEKGMFIIEVNNGDQISRKKITVY